MKRVSARRESPAAFGPRCIASLGATRNFHHGLLALAVIAVLLGGPAATVLAQGTDFSGTWNLDRGNSELPQGRGGGGRGGRGGGRIAETLMISQTATSVTVEQESGDQSSTIEYALDGSETTVELGNGTLTVTATWDGAALVTDGTQSIETGRRQLLARHHRAADAQLERPDPHDRNDPRHAKGRPDVHAGVSKGDVGPTRTT